MTDPCVIGEPVPGGGYYALPLEGVKEFWSPYHYRGKQEITDSELEALVNAFGEMTDCLGSRACNRCGAERSLGFWVKAEAFENQWDKLFQLLESDPHRLLQPNAWQPLCNTCVSQAVVTSITDKNLGLGLAGGPRAGTLIVLSAEY